MSCPKVYEINFLFPREKCVAGIAEDHELVTERQNVVIDNKKVRSAWKLN